MRVGNGGAIMTSRRVRGPAAHRAAGGEPPLASRGMQNSQRVLHALPRTAPMARRRDGDIAPYRNGTVCDGARRRGRTGTGRGGASTGGAHGDGERVVRTGGRHGHGTMRREHGRWRTATGREG